MELNKLNDIIIEQELESKPLEKVYFVVNDVTGVKEPTVRLLYETIVDDMASGVRFYDLQTLEEYNAKQATYAFILQRDLYIRLPSGCDNVDKLTVEELLEWCKTNETKELENEFECKMKSFGLQDKEPIIMS